MAKKDTISLGFEIDGMDESIDKLERAEQAAKSLKEQLAEAEDAAIELAGAEIVDQEALQKAIQRASELKAVVNETNEQIDLFASTSKYEQVSKAFGGVRDSILSLDFEEANKRAQLLGQAAGGISFGDATKSLKGLGNTFVTLGKSLLTNPLFLLAAAVVGIVLVLKELMDQVGLTKVIMEQLGKVFDIIMIPIDAMIQQLKNLTDWLGWTNNAAEDLAAANSVAMTSMANKTSEATAQIVQDLDNQIRMAKLLGENTEELERQRIQQLEANAKAQADAAKAEYDAAALKGELTDEEIEDLRLKSEEQRRAYEQAVSDTAYFEAQINDEKAKADAKAQADEEKAQEDAKKKREEARNQRIAEAEAEEARLLALKRKTQDLSLELMEDGMDKELLVNQLKYDRLIEDTLADENLKESEKQKLVEYYQALKEQKDEVIREKEKTENEAKLQADIQAEIDKQNALQNIQIQYMAEGLVKEQAIRTQAFEQEKADLLTALEDGILTQAQYDELSKQAEAQFQQDLVQLEKDATEEKRQLKMQEAMDRLDLTAQALGAIQQLSNAFAKDDEKSARRAFERNKALSIAIAIAQTAQGIMAQLAVPQDALTGANFVKAGIVAATGAAQIAQIARSKFQPSGGGGTGANGVTSISSSVSASMGAQNAPQGITAQGEANAGSMLFGQGGAGMRQGGEIRAYVVESDISTTQNRLSTYQNRAEIG